MHCYGKQIQILAEIDLSPRGIIGKLRITKKKLDISGGYVCKTRKKDVLFSFYLHNFRQAICSILFFPQNKHCPLLIHLGNPTHFSLSSFFSEKKKK